MTLNIKVSCAAAACPCTGNNWGRDANGATCLGCGAQEEFYGCADIAVDNSTQRPSVRPSVNQVHSTQIPVTRPPRTLGSQTTAVVLPLHVPGAGAPPVKTTSAAAGPAMQLGDGTSYTMRPPETTTVSSRALPATQPVIQFAGRPYNVVIHSSVLIFVSLQFVV